MESHDPASESRRRVIAIVLAAIGPWGIGQLYLGQTRRAFVWLAIPPSILSFWGLLLPTFVRFVHLGPLVAFPLAVYFVGWLAPLLDAARIPPARYRTVSVFAIIGFWILSVVITVAVALSNRLFYIEAFKIPSGAMIPTFLVGDHIFVDKLVYRFRAPRRGEAVVFPFPENPEQDFVKRIIAGPGDTLLVKDGHPWINGWEVPHCRVGQAEYVDTSSDEPDAILTRHQGELDIEYLEGAAYLVFLDEKPPSFQDSQGPFVAKKDEVWVLGDNRNNSHDSRFWWSYRGGGVPLATIHARPFVVWATAVDDRLDWSRLGVSSDKPLLPTSMQALAPELRRCLDATPPVDKTVPPPPG
jgi:signal peptidase I